MVLACQDNDKAILMNSVKAYSGMGFGLLLLVNYQFVQ